MRLRHNSLYSAVHREDRVEGVARNRIINRELLTWCSGRLCDVLPLKAIRRDLFHVWHISGQKSTPVSRPAWRCFPIL